MSTHATASHRRSYTLIELLIVIAVLGLAAALLTPHLVARDALTVQAAIRLIIADVAYAQSDAVANQQYRAVFFWCDPDGTGSKYSLLRAVPDGSGVLASGPPDGSTDYLFNPLQGSDYTVDFRDDDRFEGVMFDMEDSEIDGVDGDPVGAYLAFDPLGGTVQASNANVPGTGGHVTIVCDDERYRIEFNAFTGKMTVDKLTP